MKYLALALFLYATLAFAHHGWSKYDNTKVLKITGTVEEVTIRNFFYAPS